MMTSQTKHTLKWDLLRAIPAGVLESIATTFGVMIAVRVFNADSYSKALLVAAFSIGLLLSLAVVQWVRTIGVTANKAIFSFNLISVFGFLLVFLFGEHLSVYLVGTLLGAIGLSCSLPLNAQIYRKLYPNEIRGKLFSYGGLVRKVFSISMAFFGGWLLTKDLNNYKILFAIFAFSSFFMGLIALKFETVRLDKVQTSTVFSAFRHVKADKEFRDLLIAWMFLGVGNIMCISLFVEYISNREYGYDLSEFSVSAITTAVPEAAFLICVIFWGRLFDKLNFYLLRVIINFFFIAGVGVYFLGDGISALVIGIALHGVAKSGGNVAWSLWTTKFAQPHEVAEYMSVHTFLTGCRGLASPFIALPLALIVSPQIIAIVGMGLMTLATVMLFPKLSIFARRKGAVVEPDPRK